ncbi:MAG: ABC transporter ATP-binding protein [Turicibacter sp.]
MSLIEVCELNKSYRNTLKDPGLKGAFKHLIRPRYEDKVAVTDINFSVEKGEKVAYIGSNGAGKSTTIKMLTGILVPTSGKILVNGLDPHRNRMANTKNIGVVFGQRTQLWWDIPVIESFRLLKDIYEIPDAIYQANLKQFNEILELQQFIHQPARKLSLGQRMRADIAASLLHNPPIVYLDEPTIGLDVAVKERVHEFLNYINEHAHTTILLTSHDLADIEKICNRMIIIDKGQKIYDGGIKQLKQEIVAERKINLVLTHANVDLEKAMGQLPVMIERKNTHEVSLLFNQEEVPAMTLLERLIQTTGIKDFSIEEPGIEQIIKKVYNGTFFSQ